MQTTFERIQKVISNQLSISPNDIQLNKQLCKDLDCDSLDQVEITMALEDEFSIQIDDEDILPYTTIEQLVKIVDDLIKK